MGFVFLKILSKNNVKIEWTQYIVGYPLNSIINCEISIEILTLDKVFAFTYGPTCYHIGMDIPLFNGTMETAHQVCEFELYLLIHYCSFSLGLQTLPA